MKEKTKEVILKQRGMRMAEDGEDWKRLEMMILKSLAHFFKMHERWRSWFKIFSLSIPLTDGSSFLYNFILSKKAHLHRGISIWLLLGKVLGIHSFKFNDSLGELI